jgi:Putative restriction endonuclease
MHVTEDALRCAFSAGYWIRTQSPLDLGAASEPEPDLAVAPGKARDYTAAPTTALLVVEISDSSLAFDRKEKASASSNHEIRVAASCKIRHDSEQLRRVVSCRRSISYV